jgi:hypothetical protein
VPAVPYHDTGPAFDPHWPPRQKVRRVRPRAAIHEAGHVVVANHLIEHKTITMDELRRLIEPQRRD